MTLVQNWQRQPYHQVMGLRCQRRGTPTMAAFRPWTRSSTPSKRVLQQFTGSQAMGGTGDGMPGWGQLRGQRIAQQVIVFGDQDVRQGVFVGLSSPPGRPNVNCCPIGGGQRPAQRRSVGM